MDTHQDHPTLPITFCAVNKPRPQLAPSAMPLQPVSNASDRPGVVLEPPMSAPQQPSPSKIATKFSPPRLTYTTLNHVSIPPPTLSRHFTDSPVKRGPVQVMRPYSQPVPTMQQPLFHTFHRLGKDNLQPAISLNENFADFPDPQYLRKPPLKRSLSESAPPNERTNKKSKYEDSQFVQLPEPEEMPVIEDDGGKPNYSYAQLIAHAILRAPDRHLTLAQIYKWIMDTFTFYRQPGGGWQNSIRHNLSLNKSFEKQERPKTDAGKGSYWRIVPGDEMQFVNNKSKKCNINNITVVNQYGRPEAPQPLADALAPNTYLLPPPTRPHSKPQTIPDLPELPEMSSDATIPASDPALEDGHMTEFGHPILSQAPQSSPPQAMNSSPPVVVNRHARTISSPTRGLHSSSGRNRKRRLTIMDDSGYFSSIESSILRPSKAGTVLTSDLDAEPPRKRHRGRAEEEIIRIRSSSHDISPSHLRHRSLGSDHVSSSSPMNSGQHNKLNPVTPLVIFKKPARPPPSISPNTNLRNHRKRVEELVNSPIKSYGLTPSTAISYSPAFKMPEQIYDSYDDIFGYTSDPSHTTPATPATGSPVKRTTARPSITRATTTSNVLLEITESGGRFNTKTPVPKTARKPRTTICTPGSGRLGVDGSPRVVLDQEDLFDFGSFPDENSDDSTGVDILRGFQKIGGMAPKHGTPIAKTTRPSRPSLGSRSLTSQF